MFGDSLVCSLWRNEKSFSIYEITSLEVGTDAFYVWENSSPKITFRVSWIVASMHLNSTTDACIQYFKMFWPYLVQITKHVETKNDLWPAFDVPWWPLSHYLFDKEVLSLRQHSVWTFVRNTLVALVGNRYEYFSMNI